MPVFAPFAHYTEPLAAQILRRCMGGKRYFISLILQSVTIFLSFVASLLQVFEVQGTMDMLLYEYGYPAATVGAASVGSIIGSIISVVIATAAGSLQLVAAWMIFAAARSRKSPMGTGGFTMQKILAIVSLSLIGLYLLLVVMLLSMFSGLVSLLAMALSNSAGAVAVGFLNVFMVILVIVLILAFGYSVVVAIVSLLAANRMKNTARTGLPGKPIPMFYIVAMFIDAGFLAVGVLFMIPSMVLAFTASSLLTTLAYIPSIVYAILRALVLLEYRRELKELQNFAPSNAYVPSPAAAETTATTGTAVVQPLLRPYGAEEKPQAVPAERIICPHCGASHAPGAVFCGNCGKNL